jgi:phosphotransferase system  glucose/maltose/N-acetylglucosamine-specific IIC component
MDTDRMRTGEMIAGIAGVLLLIIMFLPWFGIDLGISDAVDEAQDLGITVPDVQDSVNFNAWESFGFIDIILFLTAIVAIGMATATAMARTVALPVAASAITTALGFLSTVLVLYRVIDPVGDGGVSRKYGLFLGLIAAAAVTYGGWRAMQEEGTTFSREADRLQDRLGPDDTAPPPPPPPPAGGTGAPPPSGPTA